MSKKFAILTRDRQSEALRMALGLLLLDDQAEVFLLERPLAEDDETQSQYKNCLEMDLTVHSNFASAAEGMSLSPEELAQRLTQFDQILPLL
ncbi:MAG: hypothetical protein A2508_05465 [Candidatus Lambdaproteobacteria bacterium RIFOXYD12_FULL_49_8]|nr:MAG: hypothetical protein A2508_05465 [Candidatus Lambdaproteobacteria bacterium RIFOXYD12_FULL_49_8]